MVISGSTVAYWRPENLKNNPILDQIDAQLMELQVAYQRIQWEKYQSLDDAQSISTCPEPTSIVQTSAPRQPAQDIAAGNANITPSEMLLTSPASLKSRHRANSPRKDHIACYVAVMMELPDVCHPTTSTCRPSLLFRKHHCQHYLLQNIW